MSRHYSRKYKVTHAQWPPLPSRRDSSKSAAFFSLKYRERTRKRERAAGRRNLYQFPRTLFARFLLSSVTVEPTATWADWASLESLLGLAWQTIKCQSYQVETRNRWHFCQDWTTTTTRWGRIETELENQVAAEREALANEECEIAESARLLLFEN